MTRELLQQALDALQNFAVYGRSKGWEKTADALRSALASPQPEPVAWLEQRTLSSGGYDQSPIVEWQVTQNPPTSNAPRKPLYLAAPPAAPQPEPVAWQVRWTNPGNNPGVQPHQLEWREVVQTNSMRTIADAVADLRGYKFDGKPCYEVRALYAAPPAAPPAAPAPAVRMRLENEVLEDIYDVWCRVDGDNYAALMRMVEQAHGIGGGGRTDADYPRSPRPDEFACPYCFDRGAAPAVREPLTAEKIDYLFHDCVRMHDSDPLWFARAIEQAHGIGGGGK